METTSVLRSLSLLLAVLLLVITLRSWVHLSNTPITREELLDCSISSFCTSKNKIHRTSDPIQPPKPTKTTLKDHQNQTPHHPLDPLTIQEINKIRTILRSHPPFSKNPSSTIHSLTLLEPEKSLVLNWKKHDPLPARKASVIVLSHGVSHIVSIDIDSSKIINYKISKDHGYPTMTFDDMIQGPLIPFSNPEFNRTIKNRGVEMSSVACLPISTGWFGGKEEGRRLIKVQCYSMEGTANFYMRPIEGLTVLVDLDSKEVIEISDKGQGIPIPKSQNTDYRIKAQNKPLLNPLNPISLEQPKGPSFKVEDEHMITWGNWEFHLKPDARAGVIISQAKVRDSETGELRSVMYKGFSSELFVPYMDPTDAWYFKTYMDAGEYGFGLQAMTLDPLNDCPRNAYYMDGVFVASDGKPYVRENMVCVFESYAGDIAWRHAETPITGMEVEGGRAALPFQQDTW